MEEQFDRLETGDDGGVSRRRFIIGGAAALVAGTKSVSANIIQLPERNRSIKTVGQSEVDIFELSMGITPGDFQTFATRAREFQFSRGLQGDGQLGPKTLEYLYIYEYSQYIGVLPEMQQKRWEAYGEMQDYKNNPRIVNGEKLYVSQIPNVFDDKIYWGGKITKDASGHIVEDSRDLFRPREGTMFAEGMLQDGFDEQARNTPNSIQIFHIGGRNGLALYDSNGIAILAAYTSPGEDSSDVRGSHTLATAGNFQMHHLSRDHKNAPMAYGINVQDKAFGIMVHAGVGKITGYDESKGCFRVGIGYAKCIYDYITKNTSSYTIDINIG